MGNDFSKQKTAANQNVSSAGAENAIKQYNFFHGLEENTKTTDLEKKKNLLKDSIRSVESSIRVDNEVIEELTKKLNNRKAQSEILKNKLIDFNKELATLLEEEKTINSSSSGGTRKKILNKNNRKTRTSYKK
jgi:hypothetical protein